MRLVAALAGKIRTIVIIVGAIILGTRTLLQGPGLDSVPSTVKYSSLMKRLACRLTERKNCCATALLSNRSRFLGKHCVVKYRIVHAQADESGKQQVI